MSSMMPARGSGSCAVGSVVFVMAVLVVAVLVVAVCEFSRFGLVCVAALLSAASISASLPLHPYFVVADFFGETPVLSLAVWSALLTVDVTLDFVTDW